MTKSCFNCANKEEIYNNGEEDVVVCEINRYTENIYPSEVEAVAERCVAYKEDHEQTNEEWLRQCTTEQLAEFIRKQRDDWSDGWYSDWHPVSEIVEWLKQPHNEVAE